LASAYASRSGENELARKGKPMKYPKLLDELDLLPIEEQITKALPATYIRDLEAGNFVLDEVTGDYRRLCSAMDQARAVRYRPRPVRPNHRLCRAPLRRDALVSARQASPDP
jgi:hypothetical protein